MYEMLGKVFMGMLGNVAECQGMLRNVMECCRMLGNVGDCSGIFRNDNVEIIFFKRIGIEERKVGM